MERKHQLTPTANELLRQARALAERGEFRSMPPVVKQLGPTAGNLQDTAEATHHRQPSE